MEFESITAPAKKSEWVGLYVKSKYDLQNSIGKLPPGTMFKIEYAAVRVDLVSVPCECCGLSLRMATKKTKNQFIDAFDFFNARS